jgi:hypothetical protein
MTYLLFYFDDNWQTRRKIKIKIDLFLSVTHRDTDWRRNVKHDEEVFSASFFFVLFQILKIISTANRNEFRLFAPIRLGTIKFQLFYFFFLSVEIMFGFHWLKEQTSCSWMRNCMFNQFDRYSRTSIVSEKFFASKWLI